VDILFVPAGRDREKRPTGDAAGARRMVETLNPHLAFPMHYATPAVNFLRPVDDFLKRMNRVEHKGASSAEILPGEVLELATTVFVLHSPGGTA